MPTTVTSSIGTGGGRDYSTLQAWEDACPANLVTDDKIWRGEAYNDSEFTAAVSISGMTTDATRYVELTTAAGQSFVDHADIRTLPLRYDQSKGVGVTATTQTISIGAAYTRLSKFQAKSTGTHGTPLEVIAANAAIEKCIFRNAASGGTGTGLGTAHQMTDAKIKNCVFYSKRWGVQLGGSTGNGNEFHHCTIIGDGSDTALSASYAHTNNVKLYNCAIFNFGSIGGSYQVTHFQYCATQFADPGDFDSTTGSLFSKTYGNQFEATGDHGTTIDVRVKSGADLKDAGSSGISGTPTDDITGTARDASPDIGAWEAASSATTGALGSDGVGAATFSASSLAEGAFAMDGASTMVMVGAALSEAAASSDGASTVQWTGASEAAAAMSADGVGAAQWEGATLAEGSGAFSMDGVSTVEWVGSSTASAVLSADGVGAASFASPVEAEPQPAPPAGPSGGGEFVGGAWGRISSKRKRDLKREDDEIAALIRTLAPEIMQHKRKVH